MPSGIAEQVVKELDVSFVLPLAVIPVCVLVCVLVYVCVYHYHCPKISLTLPHIFLPSDIINISLSQPKEPVNLSVFMHIAPNMHIKIL